MTRILVVEDSEDILQILQTELEWQGFAVDVAQDALTALEILRTAHPDVIVSDIRMPEMDGVEFIKRVRQMAHLRWTPAIALTGSSMESQVQQALAAGFTVHLVKPVEAENLIRVINKLSEKKLQRKAG